MARVRIRVRKSFWAASALTRAASASAPCEVAAVVENLLKLGGGGTALSSCQLCLSAYVRRIEAGDIDDERSLPQVDGGRSVHGI